jgi:hypothetical protein
MRAAFLCYLTQAWTADRYGMPAVTHPPGPPAGPAADHVGRHVALVWAVACGEPKGRW